MPPILWAFMSLFFWLAIIGGGFALAFRFVRAFERRGSDPRELTELREKVSRLEDSLESVTHQIERVSEAQQFTTRLLTERNESPPPE